MLSASGYVSPSGRGATNGGFILRRASPGVQYEAGVRRRAHARRRASAGAEAASLYLFVTTCWFHFDCYQQFHIQYDVCISIYQQFF